MNIAGDGPDNKSTEQVPGPSAQSKSWKSALADRDVEKFYLKFLQKVIFYN